MLGLVAIGLNPSLASGVPQAEDAAAGTVTLALGGNDLYGGSNRCRFLSWLTIGKATVAIDGAPLVDRGEILSESRLRRPFFDRPTTQVARDLLGTILEVRGPSGVRSVRVVEAEAYLRNDPASHAYRGPTRRNRSMFGPPGTVYVYRIHQVVCLNLVTRRGEAVLLRAGAPRSPEEGNPSGCRLWRFLGIALDDDGGSAVGPGRITLFRPTPFERGGPIVRTRRVGISRAVERTLRFSVARDRWVSRPRPGVPYASPKRTPAGGRSTRTRTRRRRPAGGGTSGGRSAGR